MKIEFKIIIDNQEEKTIINDFCDLTCRDIRKEIYDGIIQSKMDNLEFDLLNASFVNWIDKPRRLNMKNLITYMLNNIVCNKRSGDLYVIEIPHSVKLPHSNTPLEQIARFIDMGTEITPCTTFITRVFNTYKNKLDDNWKSYVLYRLHIKTKGSIKLN